MIKYIYKYIYKDNDRITLRLVNNNNEIARYLNDRYISLY